MTIPPTPFWLTMGAFAVGGGYMWMGADVDFSIALNDAPITVAHRIVGKRKVRSHLMAFWAPGKVRRSLLDTQRPAPAAAGGARCAAAIARTLAGAPCTYGPVPLPAGAAGAGPYSQ